MPTEQRRRRITVRRFLNAAEADKHDLEYWRRLTDEERVLYAWHLSQELWSLSGEPSHEPGLHRSVASIRRR